MIKQSHVLLGVLVSVFASSGWAAKLPEPKVDYSADSVLEAQSVQLKSHVSYTPGKMRQDMGGGQGMGAGMVMILRRDKGVVWQLMGGKVYVETSLAKVAEHDPQNLDVEQSAVGPEKINGIQTTKYKVKATNPAGKKFDGFFWITSEGITVKMDLLYKAGSRGERIALELKNLKVSKQDAALFEVPAGYRKMDLGNLMGR